MPFLEAAESKNHLLEMVVGADSVLWSLRFPQGTRGWRRLRFVEPPEQQRELLGRVVGGSDLVV